jgi:hypothetical protein
MVSLILKNKVITFHFLILFSFNSWAYNIECSNGALEKMKKLELTKINAGICFLLEDGEKYFVSSKCQTKCAALTPKNIYFSHNDLLSEFGKPGFKLCNLLDGKPELINLYIGTGSQRVRSDRCVFPDNSFVSTEFLLKSYLSK